MEPDQDLLTLSQVLLWHLGKNLGLFHDALKLNVSVGGIFFLSLFLAPIKNGTILKSSV